MSEQPMSEKPNDDVSERSTENMLEQIEDKQVQEEDKQVEEEEEYDDTDYIPDFVERLIDDPPLLPGECKDDFLQMFESYEDTPKGRAKTDAEYLLVYQATAVTWELMRLERMKIHVLASQKRPAAENVFRRSFDHVASEGDSEDIKASARKWGRRYFADPEYRKAYTAKLEAAGYGAGAIEAESFLRALPSLATVERLIAGLERRLFNMLKRLDACYATRDPEMKMPRSLAASRAQEKRGKHGI